MCALFGPSAAGGAYIPAFCDVVAMVDGNASMYLGSDRMVEMVTGEKTTLEAMGGAKVHTAESGVGHFLCKDEPEALDVVRRYLSYLPSNWQGGPPAAAARPAGSGDLRALVPASERQAFDMRRYVKALVDEDSFFEIQARWAREVTVGFARLAGEVVGVVGNNSMHKGGVLFVDSADKATRFVQLCDAFNVPLVFLSDVPGFMVGSGGGEAGHHPARREDDHRDLRGDRAQDLRRGPQGLRCRPLRDGRARLRAGRHAGAAHGEDRGDGRGGGGQRGLRHKIAAIADPDERAEFVRERRAAYETDIDVLRLASELVVDAIVEPEDLRAELVARLGAARTKDRHFSAAGTASPRSSPPVNGRGHRGG